MERIEVHWELAVYDENGEEHSVHEPKQMPNYLRELINAYIEDATDAKSIS